MNTVPSSEVSALRQNEIFSWGGGLNGISSSSSSQNRSRRRRTREDEDADNEEAAAPHATGAVGSESEGEKKGEEEELEPMSALAKRLTTNMRREEHPSSRTGSMSDNEDSADSGEFGTDGSGSASGGDAGAVPVPVPDWESDMESPRGENGEDSELQKQRQKTGLRTSEISSGDEISAGLAALQSQGTENENTHGAQGEGHSQPLEAFKGNMTEAVADHLNKNPRRRHIALGIPKATTLPQRHPNKSTHHDAPVQDTPGLLTWGELERNPHMLRRLSGEGRKPHDQRTDDPPTNKHTPHDGALAAADAALTAAHDAARLSSQATSKPPPLPTTVSTTPATPTNKPTADNNRRQRLLDKVPDQTDIDDKSGRHSRRSSHASLASCASSLGFMGLSSVAAEDDYIADLRYRSLSFMRDDEEDDEESSMEDDDQHDDHDEGTHKTASSRLDKEKIPPIPPGAGTVKRVKWMKIEENKQYFAGYADLNGTANNSQRSGSNLFKQFTSDRSVLSHGGTSDKTTSTAMTKRKSNQTSPPPSQPSNGKKGKGVGKALRSLLKKPKKPLPNNAANVEPDAASSASIPDDNSSFDDDRLERCVLTSLRLTEDRIDLKVECGKSSKRQRGYLIGNDKTDGTVWMKIPSEGGVG